MQNIAHARRPALFTRHVLAAILIGLPALPLAGGSQSIASETRYAIAYLGVAVRLLLWPLNQKAMAAPTSLGVELSASALCGLSARTSVAAPPVP